MACFDKLAFLMTIDKQSDKDEKQRGIEQIFVNSN